MDTNIETKVKDGMVFLNNAGNANGQFFAYPAAYKNIENLWNSNYATFADIAEHFADGEFEWLAQGMADKDIENYDEAYNAFADGKYNILFYVPGQERLYRVCRVYGDGDDLHFIPVFGASKSMRKEGREKVIESIIKNHWYKPEMDIFANVMYAAVMELGEAVVVTEPVTEPTEPTAEPAAEPETKTVIRERVIEREKPAVLEEMLNKAVMDLIAKTAVDDMMPRIKDKIIAEFGILPEKHEVNFVGNTTTINGVVHSEFDNVLNCIANDMPVYMYGPAGSGKNVLAEQVAEALKLDFYFMNSVTDEFKVTGFIDANGIYHESEFYKAFTKGGVFFLDEIDASAPEVLVCLNMAIANGYFSFPNGAQKASENFRVVAAGNTLGTGCDPIYAGRLQLDAASLNRFVVIPVGYDERIDRFSAEDDEELVKFIHCFRHALKSNGIRSVASYRNIKQIKTMEKFMDLQDAIARSLTKEMNQDDVNSIVRSGEFEDSNRYFKALKKVEAIG